MQIINKHKSLFLLPSLLINTFIQQEHINLIKITSMLQKISIFYSILKLSIH